MKTARWLLPDRPTLGAWLPLFAVLLLSSTDPEPRSASHTVAWYRFQNGVRDHAAAAEHWIEDASGNEQHGIAHGRPRFCRVDLPGSRLALTFVDDTQRIFVPDDERFALTASLTLEAYVEVHAYPGYASQILFRGDDRGGLDPWFLRLTDTGRLQFVVTDDRNRASLVESPHPLPLRTWLHVAGTLDDATGVQRLFLDGVEVAHTTSAIRPMGVLGGSAPGIGIGNLQCGGDQGFRGSIDEVRISAVALDPERLLPPPRHRRR